MVILYCNNGQGWEPVTEMAKLAAELFEAELIFIDFNSPSLFAKLEFVLMKRKINRTSQTCLIIAPSPVELLCLTSFLGWRKSFSNISAWIIDSFWVNSIPKPIKLSRHFDHFFITTEEDIPVWVEATKTATSWLPWGSDVLRRGGMGAKRHWDLTRIGRQPPEWDDDEKTSDVCLELGLCFQGRLKGGETSDMNQNILMEHYKQTKFLLAFSNTAHNSPHTHKTRQYITARWTDALACGATVAGVPPNEESINRLLWSGATLDLKSIQLKQGLKIILNALESWTPEQATKNYKMSLERLDWRWRFAEIAKEMNLKPKKLEDEIKVLENKLAHFGSN